MCFDPDARPPDIPADLRLPMAGRAAAQVLTLESADGARFAAAFASPPAPRPPAIVVLPDVRGLHAFYVALAERFAAAGYAAIAIDYFGRTAGVGVRDAAFEPPAHVAKTQPAQVRQDAAAALAALRGRTGATGAVAVGFCFGGAQAFLAASAGDLPLDGAVGFYGALDGTRLGIPSPLDHAAATACPVLGLFGGADPGIPAEQVRTLEARLTTAGVAHEIVSYAGAPHSFFDRRQAEHAAICQDAWRRVLGFLGERG